MVTREVLKTEIDCIQDEYLDVLYRFIKSLEMSLNDLRIEKQPMQRVQQLETPQTARLAQRGMLAMT